MLLTTLSTAVQMLFLMSETVGSCFKQRMFLYSEFNWENEQKCHLFSFSVFFFFLIVTRTNRTITLGNVRNMFFLLFFSRSYRAAKQNRSGFFQFHSVDEQSVLESSSTY